MGEGAQTGKGSGQSAQGDDSAPPTLVEGEFPPGERGPVPLEGPEAPARSQAPRAEQLLEVSSPHPEPSSGDTHTQPSLSAQSERPPASLDIRRLWRIEEQFDRHDARIRLLEKELAKTRMLAIFALTLGAILVVVVLVRG